MNKTFAVLFGAISLSACFPYVSSFPKIQAPDATYLRSGCQSDLGPKSMVYYPFHGIYISIDGSRFGLHIPSGTVVELNGKTVEIAGMIGTTPFHSIVNLKAVSHRSIGTGYQPSQFMETIDHYTTPDNFGPLEGSGNGTYLLWYLYLMTNPQDPYGRIIPKDLTEGTIEIPAITINGQHYDPQVLTFKRETFSGLAAVNC